MIPSGISVRLENRGHLPKGSRGNPAEGCPRATIPDPAPFACRPPWEAALLCLYLIDHQSIGRLNSLHQGCRKLNTWAVLEGLSKKKKLHMDQKEQVNKSTPTLSLVLLFLLTTQALVFAASSEREEGRRGWAHLGRRVDSGEHCNSVRNTVNLFVMKIRMRPGESLKTRRLSKEQKQYRGLNVRDPDFSPSSDIVFPCDYEQKKKTNLKTYPGLQTLPPSTPPSPPLRLAPQAPQGHSLCLPSTWPTP